MIRERFGNFISTAEREGRQDMNHKLLGEIEDNYENYYEDHVTNYYSNQERKISEGAKKKMEEDQSLEAKLKADVKPVLPDADVKPVLPDADLKPVLPDAENQLKKPKGLSAVLKNFMIPGTARLSKKISNKNAPHNRSKSAKIANSTNTTMSKKKHWFFR
jgi:hypothetical protein